MTRHRRLRTLVRRPRARRLIGLVFHSSFGGWTASPRYTVRFKLNRIVRRQHQALDSAFEEDSPLPFPHFLSNLLGRRLLPKFIYFIFVLVPSCVIYALAKLMRSASPKCRVKKAVICGGPETCQRSCGRHLEETIYHSVFKLSPFSPIFPSFWLTFFMSSVSSVRLLAESDLL